MSAAPAAGDSRHESRPVFLFPFNALARFLLLITLFAAPWAFGAVQPWAWGALMVLALLILVLWAAGCASRGAIKVLWSPLYGPFLAFLILASVQFFARLSPDHVATREALLKIITNLLFFFLAGQLLNGQHEYVGALEVLGPVVLLLTLGLCGLGLAQAFWSPNPLVIYWTYPISAGAPFGPYVNHNDYAGIMVVLIPICVAYLLPLASNIILRLALWSVVVLAIISVWVSGSRGGTAALAIEGLLMAAVLLRAHPRDISPKLLPVLLGVVLLAAGLFSWMVNSGRVGGHAWSVFETGRSLDVTLGDRLRVGIDTLRMARAHPWLGIGVGCFEEVYPRYMTFPSELHWSHAHDDIVEAMAETGIPGAVLILIAVVTFFRTAFRNLKERLRYEWGWMQLGAAVGAIGLFGHSFVDFNLRIPANAAWFVVCLAVATHPRFVPDRHPGRTASSPPMEVDNS